jgi:sec-independent protein translocase protein TatA
MGTTLLGFGFSPVEIIIVLVVVLLIFGPSKLPQLGEGIGKMLRGFKKEMRALDADKQAAAGPEGADKADVREPEIDVTPKAPADRKA